MTHNVATYMMLGNNELMILGHAISLGLTILTACLQLHVHICVGVKRKGVYKQLLSDGNTVCMAQAWFVNCDQRKLQNSTLL